jgi:hypothetical protein
VQSAREAEAHEGTSHHHILYVHIIVRAQHVKSTDAVAVAGVSHTGGHPPPPGRDGDSKSGYLVKVASSAGCQPVCAAAGSCVSHLHPLLRVADHEVAVKEGVTVFAQ